jgi:hypothetical protein
MCVVIKAKWIHIELEITLREQRNAIVFGAVGKRILSDGTIAYRISIGRVIKTSTSLTFKWIVDVMAEASPANENSFFLTETQSASTLKSSDKKFISTLNKY